MWWYGPVFISKSKLEKEFPNSGFVYLSALEKNMA